MAINRGKSSVRLNRFASTLQNNRGFTLVELIVVTAIIGVLASMTLIAISDFKDKTKVAVSGEEIRGLEKDLISYASEKGAYPPTATWLSDIGRSGLKDPWGNDYVYSLTLNRTFGGPINTDFDLYSPGKDGISANSLLLPESKNDVVRAGDGAFVGLAENY